MMLFRKKRFTTLGSRGLYFLESLHEFLLRLSPCFVLQFAQLKLKIVEESHYGTPEESSRGRDAGPQ